MAIKIPIPENFNFKECLWFLDRNYDDCLHEIKGDEVRKAIRINGEIYLLSIIGKKEVLEVNVLAGKETDQTNEFICAYVKQWFDIDRDLKPFYRLLKK